MNVPRSIIDGEWDLPIYEGIPRRYVIACPPRSGSNLLCDLLDVTGLMGRPTEYLNPNFAIKPLSRRFGRFVSGRQDSMGYAGELLRRRTSANGVFGLKVFYWQALPYLIDGHFAPLFDSASYVYLTREDVRGQIVSLAIAWQTNQWASTDNRQAEPMFREDNLHKAGMFIRREMSGWEDFFTVCEIKPLRITYEQPLFAPDKTVRAVCSLVDVAPSDKVCLEQSNKQMQRNSINEEWLERGRHVLNEYTRP